MSRCQGALVDDSVNADAGMTVDSYRSAVCARFERLEAEIGNPVEGKKSRQITRPTVFSVLILMTSLLCKGRRVPKGRGIKQTSLSQRTISQWRSIEEEVLACLLPGGTVGGGMSGATRKQKAVKRELNLACRLMGKLSEKVLNCIVCNDFHQMSQILRCG